MAGGPKKRKLVHLHAAGFYKPKAGEWIQPRPYHYRLACCDCGLTHYLDFRVRKGKVQYRIWRATNTTKMMRRRKDMKYRCVLRKGLKMAR